MNIIKQAEQFVNQYFKDNLSSVYSYHNMEHTRHVVQAAKQLAEEEEEEEEINPEDLEILLVAAWFHDIGYCKSCSKHETIGGEMATEFLKEKGVEDGFISRVIGLIHATCFVAQPQTNLEKIIKDADTSHIGSDDFIVVSERLRKEFRNTTNTKLNKLDWAKENIEFLTKKHQFYTNYALKNWQPIKEKNILKTEKLIQNLQNGKEEKAQVETEKILLNQKKLEKLNSPDRGIDTMFRVTLNNHMKLSQIADNKANILLSVNAIIISVALSTIVPKLDSPKNAHLIYPTFIMIAFSVATILMTIISTRPKVSGGTFTRSEIEARKINLLFFGNFHKMPLEEYIWAMKEMIKDKDFLYDSMIKDLYYLGVILNRKYKLLRTTYTIFTIGILASVIAFYFAFKSIT